MLGTSTLNNNYSPFNPFVSQANQSVFEPPLLSVSKPPAGIPVSSVDKLENKSGQSSLSQSQVYASDPNPFGLKRSEFPVQP